VRGFRPERLLPLACIGGAILLTASQFLDIFELNSAGPTARALIDSADQHWYAMAVLGVFAALATVGAVASGSKPLAASVAAAGGAALLLFLLIDLPDAGKTGNISDPTLSFVTAEADPQGGFWLELIGALILTVCGGALATLSADQLRDLWPRRGKGRRLARPRPGAAVPDTNPGERAATEPTERAATEAGSRRVRKPSRSADAG
jgi:hypothetical protein